MECFICGKSITTPDNNIVRNPRTQGLLTLITAAEKRLDKCGKRILQHKEEILSGKIKIVFHASCRKSYTSIQNTKIVSCNKDNIKPSFSAKSRNVNVFDIRNMCLICNKSGRKKQRKMISIQTDMLLF